MAKLIQIVTKEWLDELPSTLKKSADEATIRLEKIVEIRTLALSSLQKKLKGK